MRPTCYSKCTMTDTMAVKGFFAKLGLEPEIADVYLALYAYGPQTISQLARNSKVERTRLYRLMPILQESALVEIDIHEKRSIIQAAPVSNLQLLLTRKEQELRSLEHELDRMQQLFEHHALESPTTKVRFYQGLEGTKQMFWNETKAQSEMLCILYQNKQGITNAAFFDRWVRRCNERGIRSRGIISDNFIKTQQEWYSTRSNERLEHWDSRYVPDRIFPITHSMITYDNIVAYYNWKDGKTFGIEVHNSEIATAQRHFFEMLWTSALPVDDLIGPSKKPKLS